MPDEKNVLISWKIPEYIRHQRSRLWYFLAVMLGGGLIIYGIFTNNFLFALIVILFAIVSGLMHMQEPAMLDFKITDEGIVLGNKTIEYKDISSFWTVVNPVEKIKSIHFRVKNFWMPLLSVPFDESVDPEAAKKILSKYAAEDAEKEEPVLDILSRRLKL